MTKEERKAYNKAYRNLRKTHNYKKRLKWRLINPSQEELDIMYKACSVHAFQHGIKNPQEIWGMGYESLLIALHNYDKNRTKNKESYLYNKIKLSLIDMFRIEYGKEGSSRRRGIEAQSYNKIINTPEGKVELCNLFIAEDPSSSDDKLDAEYFLQRIEEVLNKCDYNKHSLFDMFKLHIMENWTYNEIRFSI